jgi:hypothetical protein
MNEFDEAVITKIVEKQISDYLNRPHKEHTPSSMYWYVVEVPVSFEFDETMSSVKRQVRDFIDTYGVEDREYTIGVSHCPIEGWNRWQIVLTATGGDKC